MWLVLDDVHRPRFLIVLGPAINRRTGETHILYRIDHHQLRRTDRRPLAWLETYQEAVDWCRTTLETPELNAPRAAGHGSAVTVEVQRQRWAEGLDPATGESRTDQ